MYNHPMSEPLRILAIYAHPDDELSAGGTLARYADEGAEITLICATRGEAATIFCADCATTETLAAVRTGELECCCAKLGIQRLEWLDWPDGGVQTVPESQAIAQLVAIIRRLRPHILLTHPSHGGYPHPDHIGLHQRVVGAFHASADPDFQPETGPAWAAPKLYVRVIPTEVFDMVPGYRQYRVQLNGQALPFFAEPMKTVDCTIDASATVNRRLDGWACHPSQHNPNGLLSTMPIELQRQVYSREYFRLFAHHLPADLPHHTDFRFGLIPAHA